MAIWPSRRPRTTPSPPSCPCCCGSSSPRPLITSSPGVPLMTSLPGVPTMVAGCPRQLAPAARAGPPPATSGPAARTTVRASRTVPGRRVAPRGNPPIPRASRVNPLNLRAGTGPMLTPDRRPTQDPIPAPNRRAGPLRKPDKSPQHTGKGPLAGPLTSCFELGGRDSNPEWQGQNLQCCRLHHPRTGAPQDSASRGSALVLGEGEAVLGPDEAAEADDPAHADLGRLGDHVAELRKPFDGAGPGG